MIKSQRETGVGTARPHIFNIIKQTRGGDGPSPRFQHYQTNPGRGRLVPTFSTLSNKPGVGTARPHIFNIIEQIMGTSRPPPAPARAFIIYTSAFSL